MMKSFYFFIFLIGLSASLYGQSSLVFHHLPNDNNLLNNQIQSLLRDRNGFLWIGTPAGLSRYDGARFKSYEHDPTKLNTLMDGEIIRLQEDANGNIWVGGWDYYIVYLRDKDCFYDTAAILKEMGIPSETPRFVHTDCDGNLWIVSNNSLFYYKFRENEVKEFTLQSKSNIAAISDDGEFLYVLDMRNRLFELQITEGVWKSIPLPEKAGFINKVYKDNAGGVWLFSTQNDQVFYKEDVSKNWESIVLESSQNLQSNFVHSIQMDEDGKIWIATDHKGLFIYDKENKRIENILHDPLIQTSIKENSIACMYYDTEGALWIGYSKKGVSCYHRRYQKFQSYQSNDFKNINVIVEDKTQNVWLGTDGYGVIYKNPFSDSIIKKLNIPGNIVVSMIQDNKGRLWIGTYLNGLICYENGQLKQYTTANSNLSDNSIWALHADKNGYLWIGTLWGHLQRMDPATLEFVDFKAQGKNESSVLSITDDSESHIYVGMVSGVCRINIHTLEKTLLFGNIKGTQQFIQSYIQSVYHDKRELIWLGHKKGITIWDLKKDTLYYMDKNSGLAGNVIKSIAEDDRNHIWVATDEGCSVIKVSTAMDSSLKFDFDNYSVIDNLSDNKLNRHAICYLSNGNMMLGRTDGYSLVNLHELNEEELPPARVVFTGLKISNNTIETNVPYDGRIILDDPLEKKNKIELTHNDKLVTVEYTAMDLIASEQVKYAYKIKGLNEDWIYTSDNKISFSYLSPGNYQLIVKASNGDDVWNETASVLSIKVSPPFWLSWYAYCIYVILIALIVYIQLKRFQDKNKKKLELQQINMEKEHAIRLNDMKLRFFTNISHDFRTPLSLIITPLQVMIGEVKDENTSGKLQIIHKNAERLLNLVNELLDFRKLDAGTEVVHLTQNEFVSYVKNIVSSFLVYADERKIIFTIVPEVDEVFTLLDVDKMGKVIFNLLSNAFKYTLDGGKITVRIFRDEQNAGVSITDNGCGISNEDKKHIFERFYQTVQDGEKTGSGIGLHIVNQYIELHKGTISVEDNQPRGTVFTFTIPIIPPNGKEDSAADFEQDKIKAYSVNTLPKLLLVEDNHEFIDFLSDNLENEYAVLKAYNGKEALDILKENDIDFVVSDAMMPIMDGFELCRLIKTNINWSHIPVIILTARTTEEYKIQGLEYGADDYITKPFNFDILKLRIKKFIEWTQRSHSVFTQKLDVSPSEITITSLDEQLVTKAIKIVEENIDNIDFSVEALGSAVGLTRGHLYKKLVSITGKTPSEFIKIIRLKRAKQLLEESQLQISEIAYAVGFNSPKTFAKNFRAEFGISPSEYIRSIK
ncbi:response regulator [Parabacteroides sp. OttesenSCG-928-G21]|nr:response regulator [Parabacteroides sp. OttesenSCG-928-G21]